MPVLMSDSEKCENCGNCERTLTGFKTKHDGCFYVSWGLYRDSILAQESIKYVIKKCPAKAISFKSV